MRWFKLNDRTYNLNHINAFEVREREDGSALLLAFFPFSTNHKTVRVDTFDSVKDAENCIAEILKGDHDLPVKADKITCL